MYVSVDYYFVLIIESASVFESFGRKGTEIAFSVQKATRHYFELVVDESVLKNLAMKKSTNGRRPYEYVVFCIFNFYHTNNCFFYFYFSSRINAN